MAVPVKCVTKNGRKHLAVDIEKLKLIFGWIGSAVDPKGLNLPGLKVHALKGNRKGTWSVPVSGNWRVTFSFEGKDAKDLDYEDCH